MNQSVELSTEDITFNNIDSENQFNSSTTSNEVQQSSIIKENSGYSSENIVKQKMIIEDNVANATSALSK